jgi:hypothetical protein
MPFEAISALNSHKKTKLLSVISSNLAATPEHRQRISFVQSLKSHFGDAIDFYGRGFVTMDDKLDALLDYKFHVVIENSSQPHYFSEKLADCFLANCFPIYHGCPNIGQYFPSDALAKIDIRQPTQAFDIIASLVERGLHETQEAALAKARHSVLYEHNLFPMLIALIDKIESGQYGKGQEPISIGPGMLPFKHADFPSTNLTRIYARMRSIAANI